MAGSLRPRTVSHRPSKRLYFFLLAFVSLLVYFFAFSASTAAPVLVRDEVAAAARDADTHKLVHDLKQVAADGLSTVKSAAQEVTRKAQGKSKGKTATGTGSGYDAKAALDDLLVSHPVILFSKSYCAYSAKAKKVLEKYQVVPRPLIFELDLEHHGGELQLALGALTGRKTVPNLMVAGKSLGGSEEIIELDGSSKLVEAVKGKSDKVDIKPKV